jgi:hypothetical protein
MHGVALGYGCDDGSVRASCACHDRLRDGDWHDPIKRWPVKLRRIPAFGGAISSACTASTRTSASAASAIALPMLEEPREPTAFQLR